MSESYLCEKCDHEVRVLEADSNQHEYNSHRMDGAYWFPEDDMAMTVRKLLDELFDQEAHEQWLNHPQRRFDGLTAQQMIDAGRGSEVEALLQGLADGVFS